MLLNKIRIIIQVITLTASFLILHMDFPLFSKDSVLYTFLLAIICLFLKAQVH